MELYLGIGDMPIYNFEQVLKTNNLAYLVVGWDERKEIEVGEEAEKRWGEIYNAYCERTANNTALDIYAINCEIIYLETRLACITSLVYGLSEANKKEFGRELNAWKIPFNIKGKIEPQIELLQRHIRIAEQNLRMKQTKLKSLRGDDEEVQETSFLKQIIIINEHLGVKIDPRKDSVEYFIIAMERLKEKLQQQKNG
ncbi:hypothetical protein [Tenacibaculum sp.]|uniref:hypothetical protein n=1 Tax=Tenacibaculum sp. TaxID=1906242 RepID=UPI003D144290